MQFVKSKRRSKLGVFVTLPSATSLPALDRFQGRVLAQRTEMKTSITLIS